MHIEIKNNIIAIRDQSIQVLEARCFYYEGWNGHGYMLNNGNSQEVQASMPPPPGYDQYFVCEFVFSTPNLVHPVFFSCSNYFKFDLTQLNIELKNIGYEHIVNGQQMAFFFAHRYLDCLDFLFSFNENQDDYPSIALMINEWDLNTRFTLDRFNLL
jgi:hypothetical protein